MPTDDRKAFGAHCEALAEAYLAERGLAVRHRNYRTRCGEVDLICESGPLLVFVEVKARRSARYGTGAEAVDARKQARLMAIAEGYLQHAGNRPCRFDVVIVTLGRSGEPAIEHLVAAFP